HLRRPRRLGLDRPAGPARRRHVHRLPRRPGGRGHPRRRRLPLSDPARPPRGAGRKGSRPMKALIIVLSLALVPAALALAPDPAAAPKLDPDAPYTAEQGDPVTYD